MASNFDLNSALIAIELWGSFSLPHLLWHGSSVYVYDGQIWRPITHTCCQRLAGDLSLLVLTTYVSRGLDSNTQLYACKAQTTPPPQWKALVLLILISLFCLFCFCFCLFVVLRPAREFFIHMETSPSLVKGFKFLPMLGTYGLWAVRVLQRATLTVISIKQWTVLCYLSRDQIPYFLVQGNLFHFMDNARWEIRT